MRIILDSKIRIPLSDIKSIKLKSDLIRITTYRDPVYAKNRLTGFSTAGLTPKIKTNNIESGHLTFWRGSLEKILKILKAYKKHIQLIDNRLRLPEVEFNSTIVLRDYQQDPFQIMINKRQTIGRAPASSGKTECMLAAIAYLKQPALILVWQERQQVVWLERIKKWFGIEAGGIGGSFLTPDIKKITVGMVQSVRTRIDQVKNLFGAIICDEVSRFAAPTLSSVVNNLPAEIRLGASDDERRRDEREFLLYDTFGPLGWKIGFTLGQCNVDIVAIPTSYRYNYNIDDWSSVIDALAAHKKRNVLITSLAIKEARNNNRVLIWSDRVAHCRYLKKLLEQNKIKVGLLIGGKKNKEEADKTEYGLNTGEINVGIGTSVAEQSINIPALNRGIMTCPSADSKLYRFRQMRGRLARPFPDKESRLFYIWDRSIPILSRKIGNIKKVYRVRIMRRVEEEMAQEQVAMTLESLRIGCKLLNIKFGRDFNSRKLEDLVKKELAKNKSYGSFACGACARDIILGLPHCPFCGAKFRVIEEEISKKAPEDDDEETTEEEVEDEGTESEDEEETEEDTDSDDDESEDDDEDTENSEEDDSDSEEEMVADATEEAVEETDEEAEDDIEVDEDDEQESEEEPPKQKKQYRKSKTTKVFLKSAETEEKRDQVRSELPYSIEALKNMKRSTLIMIAGILGHADPVKKLKTTEKLLEFVIKAQKNWKPAPKTAPKKRGRPRKLA